MLVVYLRVLFIRFLARDEWSRLQVHLIEHLDVRLLTLDVVLFSIIYVVLLLVLISVPFTLIILLTVVILIVITVHLLPHEKLLRRMLLEVLLLLLLHIQLLLLLLLLLHEVEIFCLFGVNVQLLINFATLNGKAIGELIGRDWYLKGIFSLVLLRNLISEFVSEDLVLGLSKNLLVSALLGEFFINLSLLL